MLARVVGWCIEFLQASLLVADDVMDRSMTRRGQPCWYKVEKVGLEAVNDGYYLYCAVYVILKKYCKGKPYYSDLVELFQETTLQTVTGQCLDMLISGSGQEKVDFTNYTMETYRPMVKWKTAFYSFYLPVACAMYMAGIVDKQMHLNAKTILLKMGEFFQIQDDYLDCYGDPAVTGKVGTDIQDNKCCWLVVQALMKVTPEQRKILEENYAQDDEEKVNIVKQLYLDLDLKGLYLQYEETSYNELMGLIDRFSGNLPKEMFLAYAQKIYKRKK